MEYKFLHSLYLLLTLQGILVLGQEFINNINLKATLTNTAIRPNLDVLHRVCLPVKWDRVFTAEIISQLEDFKRDWTDFEKFPAIHITAKQSTWLLSLKAARRPVETMNTPETIHLQRGSDLLSQRRTKRQTGASCETITQPMYTRKEYRQLTWTERNSFHSALNSMMSYIPDPVGAPTESAYHLFVKLHRGASAPAAHGGVGFLPWHREYLLRFELALFEQGYTGPGLPFWDSSLDQGIPDPSMSLLWTSSYMGNNDGIVASGPANSWSTISDCTWPNSQVTRNMMTGATAKSYLFSDSSINDVFAKNCFKEISCFDDCSFESDHGMVHVAVGGHMGSTTCSPSDPIFFMHHAFVDCIWEEFRQNHQTSNRRTEYPTSNIGGSSHKWDATMWPFDEVINAHGISDHYTDYYYKCANRPRWCTSNTHCKSSALWCDTSSCRCRAKIQTGGDCTGLPDTACGGPCLGSWLWRPACTSGVCGCKKRFWIVNEKAVEKLEINKVAGG